MCFPRQLEQFNMMENAISSSSLYSPGSTLNYSQAAMMGLTGSHGSLPDTQPLGYPSHSSIPNIILTGEATGVWHSGGEGASWAECHRGPGQLRKAASLGETVPLPCGISCDGTGPEEVRPHQAWLRDAQWTLNQASHVLCSEEEQDRASRLPSPASAPQVPGPH